MAKKKQVKLTLIYFPNPIYIQNIIIYYVINIKIIRYLICFLILNLCNPV